MAVLQPAGNHDADVTARGLEICYNIDLTAPADEIGPQTLVHQIDDQRP
jgi:hypothetical protein